MALNLSLWIILVADASSSNEAVHLQQRLKSLSTELVTLRNRLHVSQPGNNSGPAGAACSPLAKSPEKSLSSSAPAVPPRTTLPPGGNGSNGTHHIGHPSGHTLTASAIVHPHANHGTSNGLNHNLTTNNLISGQYLTTCLQRDMTLMLWRLDILCWQILLRSNLW